jgi:type I restriction enzyme, S subunit
VTPTGWAKTTLGELAPLSYGKALAKAGRCEGSSPVFGSSGIVGHHTQALTNGPAIIVGRKGNVGQVYLSQQPCWPIDTVYFHEVLPHLDGRFLLYLLERQALARLDKSTAVPGLSRDDYDRVETAIPPAGEQIRISEALDSHLSRLGAAVANLERAQAKLKAYRASVLKAAVTGRLVPTEAELARAENRDYEPGHLLLERIIAHRRRWEEGEVATKTARKLPTDECWKSKYVAPVTTNISGRHQLPEGWCWTTVGQMASVTGGLTKNASRDALTKTLPYLRVANVYANSLILDEIKEIGVGDAELPRLLLKRGDLLVVEGNGSPDQIGRVALWDGSISPVVHQNHLIKARFAIPPTERWVLTWLLSPGGRAAIQNVATSTSGLHTLSISKVESLPVPLPPQEEQKRILSSVDQVSSISEANSGTLAINKQRCKRLRQVVLRWAFEGKLVDQNPNDEPASILLERVRAYYASETTAKSTKSRRKARVAR